LQLLDLLKGVGQLRVRHHLFASAHRREAAILMEPCPYGVELFAN
jgi:hypothetical protein